MVHNTTEALHLLNRLSYCYKKRQKTVHFKRTEKKIIFFIYYIYVYLYVYIKQKVYTCMHSYICGELGSHHCYSYPIQGTGIPETMTRGHPSPHPEPCCCHPSAEASHEGGRGKKKREFLGVSSQK